MSNIIINQGSGNTAKGSREISELNIQQFIKDLGIEAQYKFKKECDDGRHDYQVWNDKHSHEISMPAIPLENVRYIGGEGQNIWNFPRLYVDGSSWIWSFALRVCFDERE